MTAMTEDINPDDLTKDLTEGLTTDEKIDWLIRTLQRFMARAANQMPLNYEARFATLENNVREMRAEQRRFGHKLDKLAADLLETHAQQRETAERVTALERRLG